MLATQSRAGPISSIIWERCRMPAAAATMCALLYAPHERKKDNSAQIAARLDVAVHLKKREEACAVLILLCFGTLRERRAVIWISQALIIRLSHTQSVPRVDCTAWVWQIFSIIAPLNPGCAMESLNSASGSVKEAHILQSGFDWLKRKQSGNGNCFFFHEGQFLPSCTCSLLLRDF